MEERDLGTRVYTVRLEDLSSIAGLVHKDLLAAFHIEDDVIVVEEPTLPESVIRHEQPLVGGFVTGLDANQTRGHDADDGATSSTAVLPVATHKVSLKTTATAIGRFQTRPRRENRRRLEHATTLHPIPEDLAPSPPIECPATIHSFVIAMEPRDVSDGRMKLPALARQKSYVVAVSDHPMDAAPAARAPLFQRLATLATLPPEVQTVRLETIHDRTRGILSVHMVITKRVPVIGYILLVTALVTVSSLGAALNLQRGVHPFVKLFWRTSASVLGFGPLAAHAVYQHGWPTWTVSRLKHFFLSATAYTLFSMTFLFALTSTSIGHAYIFNNCHSLLIVFGKLVLRRPVLRFELLGSALGMVGGVVTALDTSTSAGHVMQPTWQGDVVALVGAFGGVVYLTTTKKLRDEMDIFVFMLLLFLVTAIFHVPVFVALDIHVTWDADSTTGVVGWTQPGMLGPQLYIVCVCTIVGTVGYIAVMKYFDPIVVSVVMLLEPILATAIGVVVGVDVVPGLLTWMGGFFVIVGTGLVVVAAKSKRTQRHDVTRLVSTKSNARISASTRQMSNRAKIYCAPSSS
ncbi:Aste57867_21109 [Aphanomyces stellatus]|uniref:Aste57867_21109 protein n=1 Tax=Aphanomyces stellatus TaxID=120398 RepID=A0A485LGR4_9STRA|nr:hypothetical protein As57867_021041 [Aphanomyces stellatus]VFT97783.1 Aste57867_21109 [Aphanomyces stellatus]